MWSPPAKERQNSSAPAVICLSESFPGPGFLPLKECRSLIISGKNSKNSENRSADYVNLMNESKH